MIEERIDKLTAALNRVADAIEGFQMPPAPALAAATDDKPAKASKPKPQVVKDEPAPETAEKDAPAESAEDAPVTIEAVQKALIECNNACGRDAVMETLGKFEAERIGQVDAAKWPDLIAELNQLIELRQMEQGVAA